MRVNLKAISLCLVIGLSFTASATADDNYIIGKEEDKTLLFLSIAFVAVCCLFFLVSVGMALVLLRRSRSPESGGQYNLEERGGGYQSMYSSKQNGENMASPYYEQLKLNDPTNGVYQSIGDSKSGEKQNDNKQNTPPGTEKGQKDTKETEKETKTLSSFQNPAYQNSMDFGLEADYDGDMAL